MQMEYGVTEYIVNANPLENPNISIRDPRVWQSVFGGGSQADSGVTVSPRTALGYPPLWRAINLISGDIAKLPLNVYRRLPDGGKEVDKKHPAYYLLNREASPTRDAMSFKEALAGNAVLRGNGYAAILRDNRGAPAELRIMSPADTYPVVTDGEVWYVSTADGKQFRLPGRDVFHLKGLSADGLVGYDLIDLMRDALGVGMAAQAYGAKFFGNGANASGILMIPHHVSDEKIRNTISAFDSMISGVNNAHKVGLLQDGVKYQQLSITPDQAQFLETRQYEIRATVANITSCPPHKLGDDSRTSHNSLEAENQSYLDECLDRWLRKIEMEASLKLLSENERRNDTHFIEFNRNALLRMSSQDRANYYAKLQEHGSLTVNDVLRAENLPTIGEKGDRRYRPGNLLEIGEEPDTSETEQVTQIVPEPPPAPEPEQPNDRLLNIFVDSTVEKALAVERDRVTKAAKNESNFIEWVDAYYPKWVGHNASTPELAAAYLAHAKESIASLLDVSGCCTQTGLPSAVADCVATWTDRAGTLKSNILRTDTDD
jgi:HK97 family phage portal protein